jgi:deazaflavin-dependent oxidoreductase (nitroreductase family)
VSFTVSSGSRGARQPDGRILKWANKLLARWIRRNGTFRSTKALVLTTVGRQSGLERESPVAWFPGPDGSWLVVASAGGAAKNPAWYHNLAANPDKVRIALDGRTIPVRAEQLGGAERAEAWRQITTAARQFAKYQESTDREIPVIRLTAV